MKTAELFAAFGVGESTVNAKARAIERALGTQPFDPQWTLPSLAEKNPLVWMAVGRFAGYAPRSPGNCL
jgi:hypothetical protein